MSADRTLDLCGDRSLDQRGRPRMCWLDPGHTTSHADYLGNLWEDRAAILHRLRTRWGHSHQISVTDTGLWKAVALDPGAKWATEVEYTPAQLVHRLRTRRVPTPLPLP
ncbi:hypothetical protein [Nocardiopsis flavescens]